MPRRKYSPFIILSVFCSFCISSFAQLPSWTFDMGTDKKPEKFETKKLGSERTADKKFKLPRHIIQNTVSHYNYYFNANNKINAVLERASMSNQDDYAKLLSFYPYSLENTATQKTELDSVIYKATAGVLLHDLRSDWVDNFYLLIAKSYLLRKDFDSAVMTLQFINYNLFPRKKKEDDNRIVGSRDESGGSTVSIANKEKRNIIQKTFTMAPSRNESLIWLIRTLIEQEEYSEAAGLINTLQGDPNMPKRLVPFLEEVDAYWFYKQHIYDSSANHLENALSHADTKQDKSRWEFLLAQMFEMGGQYDKASEYYDKASKHTTDPLMDIFAKLNEAKMLRGSGSVKELDANIDKLLRMSKKDKFDSYRDIIFFSTGEMALQKPDTATALAYFEKSLKYNENNIFYKNKTFLRLADIAYHKKQYKLAYSYYDSLQTGDSSLASRSAEIIAKRKSLSGIVEKLNIIEREDSLQHIAAMSASDRDAFLKKLVKKMRRDRGLKDDDANTATGAQPIGFNNNNNQPSDLFPTAVKGEFYFNNTSAKGKGFNEFKSKWGTRTNTDNWRRKAAASGNVSAPLKDAIDMNAVGQKGKAQPGSNGMTPGTFSYEDLLNGLPLTAEKLAASNELLSQNLFDLAKLYQNDLEDYEEAITTYEQCLQRFPDKLYDGELYYGLYYCYNKIGDTQKAAYYKNLLSSKFANSKAAKTVNNPGLLNPKLQNPAATKLYDDIYTLFIEGKFEEAITQKIKADSLYGQNYWTPQLLYIEAVYHVRQRDDSIAQVILQSISIMYPNTALSLKAKNLSEVLSRRGRIEKYLTDLQITRAKEDTVKVDDGRPVVKNNPVTAAPPVTKAAVPDPGKKAAGDTTRKIVPPPAGNGIFTLAPAAEHYVVMILDKVDPVYLNEAKNAFDRYNRENFYSTPISINKDGIDNDLKLLIFTPFANADAAIQYYNKIKGAAAVETSWLPAAKYSFLVITSDNLQLLKTNKDIAGYRKLLNTQYPGKF